MMRSLSIAAVVVGLFASPAHAQDTSENNNGLQTGTRFERAPETVDAAQARWMQKRVVNCVFNRNEEEVRALLANSNFYSINFDAIEQNADNLFDDLEIDFCIGRLMRGANNQTYHTYMQIQFSTLRNLLAEEAYLSDFDGPPQIRPGDAQYVAGRFESTRVHPQVRVMAEMTDCMTYQASDLAHDLLRARPGTGGEEEVIDALGPIVASCANTSEAELSVPTSLIRQMAADGLWSRSFYEATPTNISLPSESKGQEATQ